MVGIDAGPVRQVMVWLVAGAAVGNNTMRSGAEFKTEGVSALPGVIPAWHAQSKKQQSAMAQFDQDLKPFKPMRRLFNPNWILFIS
jgi:hypothetical protein